MVAYLHSQAVMHGDLKTLNLLHFADDGRLRAIDFDAAVKIAGAVSGSAFAGAKFSSGLCGVSGAC